MKPALWLKLRRGRPDAPSVSLFPFLAVLICTMGALVLLLFVVTRQARQQALREAAAKHVKQAADRKADCEMVQWRITQLKKSRADTEAQLNDARLELGHVEDHARRLKQKLAVLQAANKNLPDPTTDAVAPAECELRDLQSHIAAAQREVAQAREEAMKRPRSFAVVPYQGPNETHRRPLYIECRGDGLFLQPEGVALRASDFDGPLGPGNPLAAALRAEREFLLNQGGFDPQRDGEPYPLFLVRPSGITAYHVARAAMRSAHCDFGYELIEEDWQLRFPPSDEHLKQVVVQSVQDARRQLVLLVEAAPRQYGGRRLAVAYANGVGNGESGGWQQGGSASGNGGPGGFSRGAGPTGGGYGGSSGGGGDIGHAGDGNGGDSGGGYAGGTSGGTPQTQGGGSGGAYGGTPAGGYRTAPVAGAYGNAYGQPGTASGPNGQGAAGGIYGGIAGQPGGSPSGTAGMSAAGPAGQGVTGQVAPNQGVIGQVAGSSVASGGQGGGNYGQAGTPQSGSPGAQVLRPDGYVAGHPAIEQQTPRRDPARWDESNTPREPITALRPGEYQPRINQDPPPEDKDKDKANRRKPVKSLASDRGLDWGLRDARSGSAAISRPIRVDCFTDHLALAVEPGVAAGKVIPMPDGPEAAIGPFMSAVWERLDAWGIAGNRMYWRPILEVHVAPGGERVFQELSVLLDGSGLNIEQKLN
jgi:hypothetical protein